MTVEDPFPDILRIALQLFAGTESRPGAEIKGFFVAAAESGQQL
jgi:hypothetical protein